MIRATIVGFAAAVSALAQAPDIGDLELRPIADGLDAPIGIANAADGSGRLFIIERAGRIRLHDGSGVPAEPFLDITDRVSTAGGAERGLLGLAFHPDHAANGYFFVNYTGAGGTTFVSRFQAGAERNRADSGSERIFLQVAQPSSNHNGGHLAFGPDGFLYVGMGDGGASGDPGDRAQNLQDLLGKMLRLDVDQGPPARPAAGNPFVGSPGARPEIWAFGLRNPWRFSFDRLTGDLYIGDVGQNRVEEISFQPASSNGGENYGWRRMEGSECFNPPAGCDDGSLIKPAVEYRQE